MTTLTPALPTSAPTCGTLVATDGRLLPLTRTRLAVHAAGGLARVRLLQTFANPYAEPLHVSFRLPLPADAAVAGFEFRLGEQRIVGDIDRRDRARERFEQALASGRTAALLEQERASLFTQELGNLPPGAAVEATIELDQPLGWADGGWSWRFPTTASPRYLGEAGRVADAGRLAIDVADPQHSTIAPRLELALTIADPLVGGAPGSSSHALQTQAGADGIHVTFAAAGGQVAMDRDVVLHWPVAAPQVGVSLRTVRPADGALAGRAYGLLTIVPPAGTAATRSFARDLIVLLDISGSMAGAPLAQAQAVTAALIRSLTDADRLELIAFASRPTPWQRQAVAATAKNREAALRWLASLQASGGTEMHDAILEALAATRTGAQRQVVLVTDGLIGFEQQIVGAITNGLPAASRVHVVGVGSAPNRTLTRGAARAGRGLELLLGLDDDPAAAIPRLLARTQAPLLTGLTLSGSLLQAVAPAALPDLFAGAPVRLALQLDTRGGELTVAGDTIDGGFRHSLALPALGPGGDNALHRGFAREAVEDLEVQLAAGGDRHTIDARIEALGLDHRISTRRTSWLAVSDAVTVDPTAPARREVVPHELPHGMSITQLPLRRAAAFGGAMMESACLSQPSAAVPRPMACSLDADEERASPPSPPPAARSQAKKSSLFDRLLGRGARRDAGSPPPVTATLRYQDATALRFELTGLPTWSGPARVTVVFADGSEHELLVDAASSTAGAARLPRGSVVRLVLLLAGTLLPAARATHLRCLHHGVPFEVPIA